MSEQLREQLKEMEGWRPSAYKDPKNGYLTIGYGHLIDQGRGGGISHRIGLQLLDDDIYEKRKQVDKNWPWAQTMEQARYDAMINMAFQMGVNGLGTFRKFLAHAHKQEGTRKPPTKCWTANGPGISRYERLNCLPR